MSVTVIHLTTSAQSQVATLHLIVHELLAVLVALALIAMPGCTCPKDFARANVVGLPLQNAGFHLLVQ
jgi:hypothetical protein